MLIHHRAMEHLGLEGTLKCQPSTPCQARTPSTRPGCPKTPQPSPEQFNLEILYGNSFPTLLQPPFVSPQSLPLLPFPWQLRWGQQPAGTVVCPDSPPATSMAGLQEGEWTSHRMGMDIPQDGNDHPGMRLPCHVPGVASRERGWLLC